MPTDGRSVLARIAPPHPGVVALAQTLEPGSLQLAVVRPDDAEVDRRREVQRVLVIRVFALAGMGLVAWRLFFALAR